MTDHEQVVQDAAKYDSDKDEPRHKSLTRTPWAIGEVVGSLIKTPDPIGPFPTYKKTDKPYNQALYDVLESVTLKCDDVSVDGLAAFIRKVDGNHGIGAAALAEKIVDYLNTSRKENGDG